MTFPIHSIAFFFLLTICLPSPIFSNTLDSGQQSSGSGSGFEDYQVYYEWKKVEYEFANDSEREQMIKDKKFIQENCAVINVKVFKDRMFLTTSRYKEGVPFNLNVVPYSSSSSLLDKKDPILKPFPSAQMNQEGNCSAIQFVQGINVDEFGRLWVSDGGRTGILTSSPKNHCPAKILLIDLNNEDKIILSYEFPSHVVSRTGNALKDTNVVCTSPEDCFVYISDVFESSLTVFDYKNKKSWAVRHSSMAPKLDKTNFTVAGVPISAPFGIAGSALSPKSRNFDTFYYSPIADTNIYAVKTADLKSSTTNFNLTDAQVNIAGSLNGQSDGWAMSNTGKLYFGNFLQNSVEAVQTFGDAKEKLGTPKTLVTNDRDLQWQDTFNFDNNGWLLLTTSKFHLYGDAKYDLNQVNFRVVRFPTKEKGNNQDP